MKIAFLVNNLKTELPGYTTTRLTMTAANLGHHVWYISVGDIAYDSDELVRARAVAVPKKKFKTTESFLSKLQGPKATSERITVSDLDILMLRNDPSTDAIQRPWAKNVGILFGRVAMRSGVIVLNDPNGLAKAENKMYLQYFPEEVRPKTLITRDNRDVKAFAKEQGGTIVLKPLHGSGGQNVFLIQPDNVGNLNQMIDAISRDGFVIAQEYLPAAAEGDTRLFLMNGLPLRHRGKYAAFRRIRSGEDIRSNVHAGGQIRPAQLDKDMFRVAEIVRPKLVEDAMFLVGLDIVGDKLMEINVFSPGGLGSAQKFEGVNFSYGVIKALERKVQYMQYYKRNFSNKEIATL